MQGDSQATEHEALRERTLPWGKGKTKSQPSLMVEVSCLEPLLISRSRKMGPSEKTRNCSLARWQKRKASVHRAFGILLYEGFLPLLLKQETTRQESQGTSGQPSGSDFLLSSTVPQRTRGESDQNVCRALRLLTSALP